MGAGVGEYLQEAGTAADEQASRGRVAGAAAVGPVSQAGDGISARQVDGVLPEG